MQITEAGRARVKSDAFLKEYDEELRAVIQVDGSRVKPWMALIVAFALCDLPLPAEGGPIPSEDEFNGFMALHKPEVVAALDAVSARLLAQRKGSGVAN